MDSVWPFYGPVAGGTRVTFTGQSLSVSTVTAVYFGQHQAAIDKHRSASQLSTLPDILSFACFSDIMTNRKNQKNITHKRKGRDRLLLNIMHIDNDI